MTAPEPFTPDEPFEDFTGLHVATWHRRREHGDLVPLTRDCDVCRLIATVRAAWAERDEALRRWEHEDYMCSEEAALTKAIAAKDAEIARLTGLEDTIHMLNEIVAKQRVTAEGQEREIARLTGLESDARDALYVLNGIVAEQRETERKQGQEIAWLRGLEARMRAWAASENGHYMGCSDTPFCGKGEPGEHDPECVVRIVHDALAALSAPGDADEE